MITDVIYSNKTSEIVQEVTPGSKKEYEVIKVQWKYEVIKVHWEYEVIKVHRLGSMRL